MKIKEKMKALFRQVPGYRSGAKWKRIIASIYYVLGLTMLLGEPSFGAFMLFMPVIIFGLIEMVKAKRMNQPIKRALGPFIIMFLLISVVSAIAPGIDTDDESDITGIEEAQAVEEGEEEIAGFEESIEVEEPEESQQTKDELEEQEQNTKNGHTTVNPEGKLEVHFINVGQADTIYIKAPAKNILVDGGNRGDTALNYLQRQGVEHLDLVIGTHPHADHIGGLINVMKKISVTEVIDPGVIHTSKTFEDYLTLIDEKDIRFTEGRVGLTRDFGGGATLEVLHPRNSTSSNLNDASVVVRITFGNVSFLLTGDAEQAAESEILNSGANLKSTILKVGHHGSNTSTTQAFLDTVNPKEAVIMVGSNNYGHPSPDTINRLESAGVNVYRTDKDGTVVIVTDGVNYTVNGSTTTVSTAPPTTDQPASSAPSPKPEPTSAQNLEPEPVPVQEQVVVEAPKAGKININTASFDELREVIHIDADRAQQIINLRPFTSVESLDRVKGIGPARVRDIKEQGLAYVD